MFCAVHSEGRCKHQHDYYKYGRYYLIALFNENCCYDIEGVILRIYAEKPQYPDHSEHSEHDEAREEKERQYRQEIDYAVERTQKPQSRSDPSLLRVKNVRSPYTQGVLHAEYADRYGFDRREHHEIVRELIEGLKESRRYI